MLLCARVVALAATASALLPQTRRAALVTMASITTPLAARADDNKVMDSSTSASTLSRRGMAAFTQNNVEESITLFDAAEAKDPRFRTRLWQRGLSYYYAKKCDGRGALDGLSAARTSMIVVGRDPRPVMRAVEKMFRSGADDDRAAVEKLAASGSAGDRFYAALYLGLLAEAAGDPTLSKSWISRAVGNNEYAQTGDYMYGLARVHAKRRGIAPDL
ncbi:hypothetical protein JL721_8413 [Aureococcus anophagefferens]|nr:hypothetical protein JL721_8413 [Aureococcus anophagefferens]